jgi:hypothetical protein
MADDKYRLTAAFEIWEYLAVKDIFETGILVGGPFVENTYRPIFK